MSDSRGRIIGHYASMSDAYRDWWAPVLESMAGPALDALPLSGAPERWLDLASGTGIAARRLAARLPAGSGVIAGDLVPAMLRVAREAAPAIPVVRFDAARLPVADHAFDGVVCTFALHHVREQRRTLAEVHRVLRPGGRFLVLTWGNDSPDCPAMHAWDDLLVTMGGPADDPEPPPVWSEEVDSAPRLRAMLEGVGFEAEWVTPGRGSFVFTPEHVAGVRLGVGGGLRRYRALPAHRRPAFEARARQLLRTLPPEAFHWRPEVMTARALKRGPTGTAAEPPGAADYRTTCPNCGAAMYDRGCKTRCPKCHFFTDCSDPW